MAQYRILDTTLQALANAARRINGTTGALTLANIKAIFNRSSVVDVGDDTVDASLLAEGYTAHGADGESVTGTLKKLTSSDVTVSIVTNPQTRASGVTAVVPAGYVASKISGSKTLETVAGRTYTPTTENQTVFTTGKYTYGTATVVGDANLVSENIISGKSIFGVSGSVVVKTVRSGEEEPDDSIGEDGDLYIVLEREEG